MAELSDYEKLRVANILRNEAELKRLGLDVSALTSAALGRQAPTAASRRRAVRPKGAPPTRRSARAAGLPAPDYREPSGAAQRALDADVDEEGRVAAPARRRAPASASAAARGPEKPGGPTSLKNLDADLEGLRSKFLGRIIPPLGGQVKRAVMEAASPSASPTFSRMSGIQEWRNCVMLFINVYGDGYKNSFVNGGAEVTWFAQPRQWEGTPVVKRLIDADGGDVVDGETGLVATLPETPVLLFCRDEGEGYVFCGELGYLGHDPTRVPIRFVFSLADFGALRDAPPFASLVANCRSLLSAAPADAPSDSDDSGDAEVVPAKKARRAPPA